ncbi:hypothetical protein DFP73DRAFT_600912 [Morchella snyderi]|nr:hypothetical protein DFP73DRAFT_600912 [Morchella snyderi]
MPPRKKQEEKMAALSLSDTTWIDQAFPTTTQKSLNTSVRDALAKDPKYSTLLHDIGKYIITLKPVDRSPEPSVKKRKVSNDVSADEAEAPTFTGKEVLLVKEISFSVPQRKKFTLALTEGGMSATGAVSGVTEFGVSWDNIKYVSCLPVPDKAARQWNFCVFPEGSEGIGDGNVDALVFTIPDSAPKTATGDGMGRGFDTTSYKSLLVDSFNALLKASKSNAVVQEPIEAVFYSALPQSHRKGEKAYHVKAHRGSKDGYLFFLRTGIVWAFRKPLAYFSFAAINSISYTSITKRTFNLSIHVATKSSPEGDEIEFGMIDQEEYTGIDTYIKKNRLNDASMAEARRAKEFKVNGDEGDESALEQAMADVEDEEEEDYVPGQEVGSGSGGGSDDDNDESDAEGSEDMGSEDEGSVDLEDELGSEMEEVDADKPREKRNKK